MEIIKADLFVEKGDGMVYEIKSRERKIYFNRNLLFQYITNVTCEKV